MSDVKFEKYEVEQYSFHGKHGMWALLSVDSKRLNLHINSDYGSWSYRWQDIGSQSFKQFLTQLDEGYIVGKLAAGEREWDKERSAVEFKKYVVRTRRSLDITKDLAREVWDEGTEIISQADSADVCAHEVMESHALYRLFEGDYDAMSCTTIYRDPVMVTEFVKKIYYPWFVATLKEELSAGPT